jgi:small-conductance mechanosensitive channel
VMLVSTLLIDLPRIAAMLWRFDDPRFIGNVFGYIDNVARPLLALFLIVFATMQITLTFHSESFRKAWRDHFAFVRRNKWQFMWFLLIAGLHFFLASFLNKSIVLGFGDETATALVWSLVYPLFAAALAAWMLAAWVCLFKRCETAETRQREIRF